VVAPPDETKVFRLKKDRSHRLHEGNWKMKMENMVENCHRNYFLLRGMVLRVASLFQPQRSHATENANFSLPDEDDE